MRTTTLLYVALLGGCSLTGTPDRLRDCADCPEMVTVLPASRLSAPRRGSLRRPDELPERTFTIREPFAVSRYEITRDQYEAFVRATGRRVEGSECLSDRRQRGNWVYDGETTFRDPGFSQTGDHGRLREFG